MKHIVSGFFIFFVILGAFSLLNVQAQPADPTNFTATPVSSCAIRLDWEGVTSEYDIERDGVVEPSLTPELEGEGAYFLIDSHDSNLWGAPQDDPIDPGTNNSYRIRAFDSTAGQYSNWVGPQSATTNPLPPKPGKPVGLASSISDEGNIEVAWETSPPTSDLFEDYGGFEIWIATSDDGENYSDPSKVDRIPASPEFKLDDKYFYSIIGDENLSYQYIIYTQEVGGLGCDLNNLEHVILSNPSEVLTVPVRPADFNARFVREPRKVELTWADVQKNPNETNFEIQRSLDNEFSSVTVFNPPADAVSYDDTNIIETGSETYYYRIRSCIGSDCSFWSPTVNATVGIPVPENLEAQIVSITDTSADVNVTWDEEIVLANSTLNLERAVAGEDFVLIGSFSPFTSDRQSRSFTDSNLELGEEYIYRAEVVLGESSSGYSGEARVNLDIRNVFQGVAWASVGSHGVGWIKFNSVEENGVSSGVKYSVQADSDGLISGVAWAGSEYGWLSFNKGDLVGCLSGTCEARFDSETGNLNGWARFLAPVSQAGNSSWDGWVHLSEINYGVSLNTETSRFSGAAWGGDVVGWVAFGPPECTNCTVRATLVNQEPSVSDVLIEGPSDSWCSASPFFRVRWIYNDPDGDLQESALIEFIRTSDNFVAFSQSLTGLDGGQSFYRLDDPLAQLASDTSYKARVTVSDGIASSIPSDSGATTTPSYYYPLVDFDMDPDPTATGTITTFTDISSDRSDGVAPLSGREWTFENAAPSTSDSQEEFVIFNDFPSIVTLTREDTLGVSCTAEREVTGGGSSGPLKRRIFRER